MFGFCVCGFCCCSFAFVFVYFLSLAGNPGRLIRVKHSSRKSSATHSYQCVQHFPVCKQWCGCHCLVFSTCVQMLMHAIAHGGCTDTVRESALKVHSKKIPSRTGDSNPSQYFAWRFGRMLYPLTSTSPPSCFVCIVVTFV